MLPQECGKKPKIIEDIKVENSVIIATNVKSLKGSDLN